ncbi:MAG: biotin/lipoyl-containing protein [Candidatus Aminicenantes bacterium]
MDHEFIIDGKTLQARLDKKGNRYSLTLGNKTVDAEIRAVTPNIISLLAENRSLKLHAAHGNDGFHVFCRGDCFLVQEPADDQACFLSEGERAQADMLVVKAPMPGKVIKIHVKEEEVIQKNQTLVIVEAMKMENEIKARISGRVKKIHVTDGDLVDSTRPMLELEMDENPADPS